jgi:hypothetical protein
MEMQSVQSSQIAQVGHDGQSLLRVLFRRGGLYEYQNVTPDEFKEFVEAPSIGVYFGQRIKTAKPCTRLSDNFVQNAIADASPAVKAEPITITEVEPVQAAPAAPEEQNQEVERVAERSSLLVRNAVELKVTDMVTQGQASETLLAVASMLKQIETTFKPMKDAAFRAHRVVCDQETKLKEPLLKAEQALKGQIGSFVQEQRRIALETEQELRRVEQERARVEAEREAQERAIEDAVVLEAQGNVEAAEAVLNNPAPAPVRYVAPASVAPMVAQTAGVTTRMDWDFRVTNHELIPREYMLVNETAIRNAGKNTKGKVKIAGVEFFDKPVVSASRGR